MPNRSTVELPAVYAGATALTPDRPREFDAWPLEIFDFKYLHFHDNLELGYCASGSGVCRVEEREFSFSAGDFQIIFPFQKHLSKSTGGDCSRWYWLNIDPFALLERIGFTEVARVEQLLHCEMGLYGTFPEARYPAVAARMRDMFEEAARTEATAPHHTERCALTAYQLLLELAHASEGLPKLSVRQNPKILYLSPALDAINDAVRQGHAPAVTALAESCSMSVSHFRRLFHEMTGFSPRDYIAQCFLRKAQRLLLSTEKSILEISAECGFEDISGFNRQFPAKTGMTPSEFRRTTH